MAKRVAVSTLNASTLDIMNVIRQNASYEYQQNVPKVQTEQDVPRVGEVIYGTPAFANQFINALVNRIAIVRIQSATFNNPYAFLKKGYIEFGESVEDIFVGIINAVSYSAEKAEQREFKRTIPNVKSTFHTMNWRVFYPITIQDEDLRMAFLNADGVTNLITKIVDQVYTSAEYDEFLLFKYLLIKGISSGNFKPVSIGDGSDLTIAAKKFRGVSNTLPFIKSDFNISGVQTNTPKERQCILMDAMFNAEFDVDVLASAFNMDKANFMGRLALVDDWTTFDNARFYDIMQESDGIEEVTDEELALLANVKSVILDENWFQVYDNLNKFKEREVASGMYWNYFYHTWKTVSFSPFANAVVFVTDVADVDLPTTFECVVTAKDVSDVGTVFTLTPNFENATLSPTDVKFIQTLECVEGFVGVQDYGAYLFANDSLADIKPICKIGETLYNTTSTLNLDTELGTIITVGKMV